MPKYFGGNLATGGKLLKTRDERAQDKLAKELSKEINTSTGVKSSGGKANDIAKQFLEAADKNNEMAMSNLGVALVKELYGDAYGGFAELLNPFLATVKANTELFNAEKQKDPSLTEEKYLDKVFAEDLFLRFIINNGKKPDKGPGGKDDTFPKWLLSRVESNPKLLDDKSHFIYNRDVQDKANSMKDDGERFLNLLEILFDPKEVKTYFIGGLKPDILKKIFSQLMDEKVRDYPTMKKIIDYWQNLLNNSDGEEDPEKAKEKEDKEDKKKLSTRYMSLNDAETLNTFLVALGWDKGLQNITYGDLKKIDYSSLNKEDVSNMHNLLQQAGVRNGINAFIKKKK